MFRSGRRKGAVTQRDEVVAASLQMAPLLRRRARNVRRERLISPFSAINVANGKTVRARARAADEVVTSTREQFG